MAQTSKYSYLAHQADFISCVWTVVYELLCGFFSLFFIQHVVLTCYIILLILIIKALNEHDFRIFPTLEYYFRFS